jgi:hypothetical protein
MSELRFSERPGGAKLQGGPESFEHDLSALRDLSDRDLPGLETSLRAARRRAAGENREGFAMALRMLKARPALTTVLAAFVVAAALLVIPISYERTVGYDVALSLDGGNVAQDQIQEIARGFQETLGARTARVTRAMDNGHLSYRVEALTSRDVRAAAAAFARGLRNLGYTATVSATPRREAVSTNVYAYAMSRVIEISTDGKSAAQLESEIRSRLAAAGVTQATVSVTDGSQGTQVKIRAEHVNPSAGQEVPELVLTKNGKPIDDSNSVRVMEKKDASGTLAMSVVVRVDGKSTTVEIPNPGALTDAALAARIQSQLLTAGMDAIVTVHGDQISVEKRKP